ncbi:MAG: hypothetical protein LLF94_02000 [Chlamydiales bacterium]|nr:hypothetical protein [Chlamydiales bacterium]
MKFKDFLLLSTALSALIVSPVFAGTKAENDKRHFGYKHSLSSSSSSQNVKAGHTGPTGPRGPTGATGPKGSTGAMGATGPAARAEMVIPFASGAPIALSSYNNQGVGDPLTGSFIGFGKAESGYSVTSSTIDISGLSDYAFSIPRDGTITSLATYFSVNSPLVLTGTTVTVHAQLYASSTLDNIFTPVPGASVDLAPTLTGASVPTGTSCNGIVTGLNIPVTAGTRLLLVFTISTQGTTLGLVVEGFVSAGLGIQ